MKKHSGWLIILILLLGSNCKNETPLQGGQIEQTSWQLVRWPQELPPGVVFKLSFEAGTLFGEGPCNRYHATYQVDGNELNVFGGIGRTSFECPANGPLEKSYYNYLADAQIFGFRNERLIIRSSAGDLAFEELRFSSPSQ